MSFLDQLLGNNQQRQDYQDYFDRYQRGEPWEGYSDREVMDRYRQVAPHLREQDYEEAAREAFARMTPEQRRQFADYLRQQARQQRVEMPDLDDDFDRRGMDPGELARATTRINQRQPNMLEQLLGGGGGQMGQVLSNPLAKAALAGIAAIAAQRIMGGGINARGGGSSSGFSDLGGRSF
jgi:hypothetical protein